MDIIERARLCVDKCEPAIEGQGGNARTFSVACVLVWGFGLEPAEALGVMELYNQRCDPPWERKDLERMLKSAVHFRHDKPRGYLVEDPNAKRGDLVEVPEIKQRKPRAEFSLEALKKAQDPALNMNFSQWRQWLLQRSLTDPRTMTAEQFLDGLYEPGEKVLIFNHMRSAGNYGRVIGKETWKLGDTPHDKPERVESLPQGSQEGMHWLMQPVNGKWMVKYRSTEMSRRTKANVTRWPFILLESDKAPHELWLNVMVRARIRICAIIMSGGRSLHVLVRLDKGTEDELLAEIHHDDNAETLSLIGCDAGAMHSMEYPRLPNTWREGKRMGERGPDGQIKRDGRGRAVMKFVPFASGRTRQALLYFNPAPVMGRSILEGEQFER